MKHLTFLQKLWLPLAASLLCLCATSLFYTLQARDLRINERRANLADVDKSALSIVQGLAAQASAGQLTVAAAQVQAKAVLNTMRYGDDGYIAIVGMNAHAIQNPGRPDMEGKDMSGIQDANGVYVFREIASMAAAPAGEGYLPSPEQPGDRVARTRPHRADAVHSGLAPKRRTAPPRARRFEQGEARNALARAVFIHRLGEIRDRTFEQQRYRASGLNLVTAAIVLWNTIYLERATQALREKGKLPDAGMLHFYRHWAGSTST